MLQLRTVLVAIVAAVLTAPLCAQVWTRDPTFAPVLRNDRPVLEGVTFMPMADGRTLLVGSFTHLLSGELAAPGLARLNADGTPDRSFNAALAANESIDRAVALRDGRVLALRRIDSGPPTLVRFLADGRRDTAFAPITATYWLALAMLPDDRVLAWNGMLSLDGTVRDRVARLAADGTLDPTFTAALPDDVAEIIAIVGAPDGKLLISARVRAAPGTPTAARLFRLAAAGAVDPSFTAINSIRPFTTLAVQPDGKFLAAVGGTAARYTADGALDPSFNPQIPNLQAVERVVVRSDGQIIVQAQNGTGSGPWPSNLFWLSPEGGVQRELRSLLGEDRTLRLASVLSDGAVLVVHGLATLGYGTLSSTSAVTAEVTPAILPPQPAAVVPTRAALARVSADGSSVATLTPGVLLRLTGMANNSITDAASRLIITGYFTHVDGQPRAGIARFTPAGALDPAFAPAASDTSVSGIALQAPDGGLIVYQTALSERGTNGLYSMLTRRVRLRADGSTDAFFAPETELLNYLTVWHAIASDGRMLISRFAPDSSREENLQLAWLGTDGRIATTLPTRFAGWQPATPISPAVTGTASGQDAGQVPTLVTFGNPLRSVRPLADGRLLVAGTFTRVNGVDRPWLARLDADGSVDSTYAPDLSGFVGQAYVWFDARDRVIVSGRVWSDGELAFQNRRLLPDGRRDPSYLFAPGIPDSALLRLENGLPDLNFPSQLTQPDGTKTTLHSALTAADGTTWTVNPLARFTASDIASITVPPADRSIVARRDATFFVGLGSRHAATYQWLFEGAPIDGAMSPFLTLTGLRPAQAGHYQVRVTIDGQTFTSAAATLTVLGGTARIVNVSALANVAPGSMPIVGFTIASNGAPREWLVRAIGQTLANFRISSFLADPELTLLRGATEIARDRGGATASPVLELGRRVGAFPVFQPWPWFPNWKTSESALVSTLAPGSYSARVTSVAGNSGTTLLEVYDSISTGGSGALENLSLRTRVDPSANAAVLGFVVTGNTPLRVLIRGVGPALARFGIVDAITDPQLVITRQYGTAVTIAEPGSADTTENIDAARRVGAFAFDRGSRDAAALQKLEPGAYTLQLASASRATGAAMIEIYIVEN